MSPPITLIAAKPHHNPASATIAAPPIIAGGVHDAITVVGTPVATVSIIVATARN